MSLGESSSPLGKVRGLGSAGHGGEHWLSERITSIALLLLGTTAQAQEPGRGGAVSHSANLHRFALAAVRQAPEMPCLLSTYALAAVPEVGGVAGVGGIAVKLSQLASLDLIGKLGAELEVEALVVNRP